MNTPSLNPYTCSASPTTRHAVAKTDRLSGSCLYCTTTVERISNRSGWWYVVGHIDSLPREES